MRKFFSQFWPALAVATLTIAAPLLWDNLFSEDIIVIKNVRYVDHSLLENLTKAHFEDAGKGVFPIGNLSIHCFDNISGIKLTKLQLHFQDFRNIDSLKFQTDTNSVIRDSNFSSKEFQGYVDVPTFSPFGSICVHVLSRGGGFARIVLTGDRIDVTEPSNADLFFAIVKYKFSIFDILMWIFISAAAVLWMVHFLTRRSAAQARLGE